MTDDDLKFDDPVLQARYRACREQASKMLGYPIGKIPLREKEHWHQVRDAFKARMAELEAQRQHEVPQ